jgi:hypothetical protein
MTKHTPWLAGILLLLLATVPAVAVDTIADVKTLGDLSKQQVIHLDDGWDVQVGMRDPDADAGPFKLIYCLAKSTNADRKQLADGEFELGPLSVDFLEPKRTAALKRQQDSKSVSLNGEKLFCQVLPVAWSDDLLIRVHHGDRILLEKRLGQSNHEPFYWTQFAIRNRGLQLMYTPGFQEIGTLRTARQIKKACDSGQIAFPVLTNRLDFIVNEHLLSLVLK